MKVKFLILLLVLGPLSIVHGPAFAQSTPPWQALKEITVKIDLMNGNKKAKAKIIKQALEMAGHCVAERPKEAGCYYYRGQVTGLYYENHLFGYQGGVRSMIADWQKALELDPKFDHGGPDRMLGEIYTDLPKYFGTKDVRQDLNKAIQHLEKSIQIAPDYPTQRIDLATALLKANRKDEARIALESAKTKIPKWPEDPYFSGWQEDAKELEGELE